MGLHIKHLNKSMIMKRGFTIGILVAAAAGLVAGLLFAPEKGKDLRKKIKDKGNELSDKIKDSMRSNRERAKEMREEFMEG